MSEPNTEERIADRIDKILTSEKVPMEQAFNALAVVLSAGILYRAAQLGASPPEILQQVVDKIADRLHETVGPGAFQLEMNNIGMQPCADCNEIHLDMFSERIIARLDIDATEARTIAAALLEMAAKLEAKTGVRGLH